MMNAAGIQVGWAALAGVGIAVISGYTGYRIGVQEEPRESAVVVEVEEPALSQKEAEPEVTIPPRVSDAEIEALLAETFEEPRPDPINEERRARQERWETMPLEQRRMLRQSMFAALAKVDGLEEVGDAIRGGKIDPREFNLNPEAIADRMEFYADTMDREAMEDEVTRTLQDVVNQARMQLGR